MQTRSVFQGTTTPRLQLLGKLASGGMGTVSLARTDDGTLVAVKRMHPHLAEDSHFLRMFLDEIWLTGALRHDNVVRLVGWGVDDNGPYFATEFVVGAGLGEMVARAKSLGERLPCELVAYIGARMAEGLHAAHTLRGDDGEPLGIVHRDVTPSNVLLGFDGSIRLTDFGVAKALQKTTKSRTGMLKGKLSYMAPEYADGRGVDGRSDVYSLGVVLFQLLTGQRPFSGESDMELLRKVVDTAPPTVASLAPDLDAALAAIVDRLLEKRPEARARDALQIATELDGWLSARGYQPASLRLQLAASVTRHCHDRRARLELLMARDGSDGETLITQKWTAGARPDETMARRAMALTSVTEGTDSPVKARRGKGDPRMTRVAPVAVAPTEAPPLFESEDVTAQTFVPVRRQLLGSRWGMFGIAVAGASIGAVVVALVVAAGRPPPQPDAEPVDEAPVAGEGEVAHGDAKAHDDAKADDKTTPPKSEHHESEQPIQSASAVRPSPRHPIKAPPPKPKAACTPAHFDYPACLKKP